MLFKWCRPVTGQGAAGPGGCGRRYFKVWHGKQILPCRVTLLERTGTRLPDRILDADSKMEPGQFIKIEADDGVVALKLIHAEPKIISVDKAVSVSQPISCCK